MTAAPVPTNRMKAKLAAGELCVGTMLVEIRQVSVMTMLANAGFDFVLVDNEHGPFSVETIADLCRAARSEGVTPVVRIPELTYAHVAQSLDGGAQAIMLPRVVERSQVEECVRYLKYTPQGRRGAVLARGHTAFKAGPLLETLAALNNESMLVVQVETKEAVDRLDEILSVPGVDAALIGPTDLSVALGVGGQMEHPALVGAIEATMAACARHNVVPAIHTNDTAMTAAWARKGMRMVSINSEVGLLTAAARGAIQTIRSR
jgi:2-keto-3-deoxy-L-rhamnonate aldolase RhmA